MKIDSELRQELFGAVLSRLLERAEHDPALVVKDRAPTLFAVRHGHSLTFFQGQDDVIAKGIMEWNPNPDQDEPFEFRVTRVSPTSSLLRMTKGPEGDVDVIADDIVNTFLRETEDLALGDNQ